MRVLLAALALAAPPPPGAPLPERPAAVADALASHNREAASRDRRLAGWAARGRVDAARSLALGAASAAPLPEAHLRPRARAAGTAAAITGGARDGRRTTASGRADAADQSAAHRVPHRPDAPRAHVARATTATAERRFGVGWEVLAAVNFVETGFNKLRSRSSAGAQGPMQFMPNTWRAYGLGGDVHDPRDAILGAANYLSTSGAARDLRGALWHYNHSDRYVDAVVTVRRADAPRRARLPPVPRLASVREDAIRPASDHRAVTLRRARRRRRPAAPRCARGPAS